MPQPLGFASANIHYSPKGLLVHRPQHLAGIGLVATEWAALEDHLVTSISGGLFMQLGAQEGKVIPEAEQVVRTTLLALESQAARLGVIEDLLEPRVSPEMFSHWLKDVKPELRKRAKERNRVVHGLWGWDDKYPSDVFLIDGKGKHVRYRVEDFSDIADRIIATSNVAFNFMRKAGKQFPFHE